MANRYDLLTVREDTRNGEKKAYFTRIGVAFPSREGDGFTLLLDALPVAGEGGQARVIMKPPRDSDERGGGGYQQAGGGARAQQQAGGGYGGDLDQEIPF